MMDEKAVRNETAHFHDKHKNLVMNSLSVIVNDEFDENLANNAYKEFTEVVREFNFRDIDCFSKNIPK